MRLDWGAKSVEDSIKANSSFACNASCKKKGECYSTSYVYVLSRQVYFEDFWKKTMRDAFHHQLSRDWSFNKLNVSKNENQFQLHIRTPLIIAQCRSKFWYWSLCQSILIIADHCRSIPLNSKNGIRINITTHFLLTFRWVSCFSGIMLLHHIYSKNV